MGDRAQPLKVRVVMNPPLPRLFLEFGPIMLPVIYLPNNQSAVQVVEVLDPYIGRGPQNWDFYEDFSDGNMDGWTSVAGTWAVAGSGASFWVSQSTFTSNSNLYTRMTTQDAETTYYWSERINNYGGGAGMHFRATEGTSPNRGDSYLVWLTPWGGLYLYESVTNVLYLRASNLNVRASFGRC